MSSSAAPERLPLTGADAFLRAFDDELRRRSGASHVSQAVLRLGPGFEPEALREAVARAARAQPILRAPLRRRLGVGPPVYDLGAARRAPLPAVEVSEAPGPAPAPDAPVPERFHALLNRRMRGRRGELLRFDAVRYDGGRAGTDLAVSWLHMLLDGAGSEAFLRWLDAAWRGERAFEDAPGDDADPAPGLPPGLSARERGRRATAWRAHMAALAERPPRSPAGPLRSGPQALRYELLLLGPEESARARETARRRAGLLTPMLFYLAAAIRAHHAVFRRRGADPGRYVVPLPVNLRPKGAEAALFRTRVSLLWFGVDAETAEDPEALLASLREQRRAAIKEGLVESGVVAMDYARWLPARLYARMARRPFGGEAASFFFAWTDEFLPGTTHFLGAPLRHAFHAPAVPPSPGSALALSTREGRLHATHVFQEGVMDAAERAVLAEALRRALLEEDAGGR